MSTIELLKATTLFSGGLFVGTAVYITVVEIPSRDILPIKSKWMQWRKSFNRAARFVMLVGMTSAAANIALYFNDESEMKNLWLVPPGIFLLGGLYTATVIIPEVNIMLEDNVIDKKGEKWVDEAIGRWGTRHMLRDFLNIGSFMVNIYCCLKS